jgi:hypothetical protein
MTPALAALFRLRPDSAADYLLAQGPQAYRPLLGAGRPRP